MQLIHIYHKLDKTKHTLHSQQYVNMLHIGNTYLHKSVLPLLVHFSFIPSDFQTMNKARKRPWMWLFPLTKKWSNIRVAGMSDKHKKSRLSLLF